MEARPELAGSIHRAIASAGDGGDSKIDLRNLAAGIETEPLVVFTAIQPDRHDVEAPPEDMMGRILFIVNNLAPSNFDSKLTEMREQSMMLISDGSPTTW
jgi:CCR4-NOT transcription complex subunit 1